MVRVKNKGFIILIVIGILVIIYCGFSHFRQMRNLGVISRAVQYLNSSYNRQNNLNAAIKLNNGISANTCVYFASGALREGGLKVPEDTANTTELIAFLKRKGFKKDYNLDRLRAGEICFTSESGNKEETPDHTYIFISWVDSSHEDAYVCDNQKKDYGDCYHKRNVKYESNVNGQKKSKTIYYMKY
ncbi:MULTISPECIES: hypothetical protein [Clostridium]|uniref:hypothetical protein n=1 Tax=Clostridium TaxID=1485 RepID=UPI0008263380|nr:MULTISPECIES: hypothetical protein [Clostridium]PJI08503.1 hypothetical protein CUB90_11825 [Clostridium sp. CT7]